jgi:hypothetical protein
MSVSSTASKAKHDAQEVAGLTDAAKTVTSVLLMMLDVKGSTPSSGTARWFLLITPRVHGFESRQRQLAVAKMFF